MRKLVYVWVAAVAVSLASCKDKTEKASAGDAARTYTEQSYRRANYDRFVDGIHFEKNTPRKMVKDEKRAYRATMDRYTAPEVKQRGGLKETRVVGEKMTPDGNRAEVMLRNFYNDGSIENLKYDMVKDRNKWKIQVGNDKEVWRTRTDDGRDVVVKLKDNDYKSFVKVKVDGEKAFVKDINPVNSDKEVVKVLEDGDKDVVKVSGNNDGTTEVKTKHDGEKDVVTIQ